MTDQTPAPSPADRYRERVATIERNYQEAVTQADGDYSRVQAYAGLVRQELINTATRRRQVALEAAEYELVTTHPDQTEGDTPA